MPSSSWAAVARSAACLAAVAGVAGCSASGAGTTSSTVTATGRTLTIVISQPPGAASDPVTQDVIRAEELAFTADAASASGHYRLRLARVSLPELSSNARAAIEDPSAIAYLGESAPGASEQSVGITNSQDLLQVSPTDTALELTQGTSAIPKAPNYYYESHTEYGRTFVRVAPSSAVEAEAQVKEMRHLGVSRLAVETDGSDYGRAVARAVQTDARAAGITLTGGPSGADGVFVGAASPAAGAKLIDAAASSAPSAKLFGTSSLDAPAFLSAVGPAAERSLLISTPGVMPSALTVAGRAFVAAYTKAYQSAPADQAIFGYAAMAAVLRAITDAGTSADNRTTVARDLRRLKQPDSVLGSLSFSSSGDSDLGSFVFNRIRSGGVLVPTTPVTASG